MRVHPDIDTYPEHRPERALLSWFEAIASRDYREAAARSASLAQGIDRQAIPEAVQKEQLRALARWWRGNELTDVEITGASFRRSANPLQRGIAYAEVTCILRVTAYAKPGGVGRAAPPEHVRIVLIREAEDGQPDVRGEWRVKYQSMRPVKQEVA